MFRSFILLIVVGHLLVLGGCATRAPTLVSTTVKNQIDTVRVLHVQPDRPIFKQSVLTHGGDPLFSVLFNQIKVGSAQSEIEPFLDLIQDIDIGAELNQSISRELEGLDWARVTEVEEVESGGSLIAERLDSLSEDALIIVAPTVAISPYFDIVEFTAMIALYAKGPKGLRVVYANRVYHQSRFFSSYETVDKERVSANIENVKQAFYDSFIKPGNGNDYYQFSPRAERWLDDYALKLNRRARDVDVGSANDDGVKWLRDPWSFKSLVYQGIEGLSDLVRLELNHKGLSPDGEIVFLPKFHRAGSLDGTASLVSGYIVKQSEDRQVVRLLGREFRRAMVSMDKDMPVLSLRNRNLR